MFDSKYLSNRIGCLNVTKGTKFFHCGCWHWLTVLKLGMLNSLIFKITGVNSTGAKYGPGPLHMSDSFTDFFWFDLFYIDTKSGRVALKKGPISDLILQRSSQTQFYVKFSPNSGQIWPQGKKFRLIRDHMAALIGEHFFNYFFP